MRFVGCIIAIVGRSLCPAVSYRTYAPGNIFSAAASS
jgi:hypothetical protein